MADSFNLGWKLANVIRGYNAPEILHSYSAERQAIARYFALRGVDRSKGALVIVRPDHYVAAIIPIDQHRHISSFFDRFMTGKGDG